MGKGRKSCSKSSICFGAGVQSRYDTRHLGVPQEKLAWTKLTSTLGAPRTKSGWATGSESRRRKPGR